MRKIKSAILSTLVVLAGCNVQTEKKSNSSLKTIVPEKAKIFVTARDTNLRLTNVGEVSFQDFGQPLETQVCVFLDLLRPKRLLNFPRMFRKNF